MAPKSDWEIGLCTKRRTVNKAIKQLSLALIDPKTLIQILSVLNINEKQMIHYQSLDSDWSENVDEFSLTTAPTCGESANCMETGTRDERLNKQQV